MKGFEGEEGGVQGSRGDRGKEPRSSASVSPSPPRPSAPPLSEPTTRDPNAPHTSRAKVKHTPERTCAACRTKMVQSDLYRIRKTRGGWTMDSGVKVGRSAYLCSSPYCHVEKRLKRTFGAQAAQIAAYMSAVLKALEGQKEK